MKQKFDLDTWLKDKSRKVVTRGGSEARIICWDRYSSDDNRCIVALVHNGVREDTMYFDKSGHYSCYKEGFCDLLFADEEEEEELTEFERMLRYVLECYSGYEFASKSEIETLKLNAKSLLDLARKEILEEFSCREELFYKNGFERGRESILKDLPKWKRSNSFFNTGNKFELGKTSLRHFDGYEITYSELEKLSKEE